MPVQIYELGAAPRLIITCEGMLDVRGSERDDVRLEGEEALLEASADTAENVLTVRVPGNCAVRMPQGGHVEVRSTLGNLRVRDVAGVDVDSVYGTASVRGVEWLHLNIVNGEGRIRDVEGAVEIAQANGSLTIQGVCGDVRVDTVNGDVLLRDISGGMHIGEVNGSLAVRTDFAPETTSRFVANAEAVFRVSTEASVRFLLPLDAQVDVDADVPVTRDDAHQIVTLGAGAATVEVTGTHEIAIRQRGRQGDDTTFAYTFALGHDLSEHLASISAQIESKLDNIEVELGSTLPDRVLSHVERRLSQARRQVAAAQRRVEREAERRMRDTGVEVNLGGRPAQPPARRSGVTDEDRLAVLTMLEQGKISVEEAEKLLSALEGD